MTSSSATPKPNIFPSCRSSVVRSDVYKRQVRCLLDEFANIGQIPKFDKLIATIRSREISASIILQSQSQLKTIYKDAADTITGNCDCKMCIRDRQRENILPSEKAKAYKMKLEAIKRRAGRPSRNSVQLGQNYDGKTSREQIAENSPDSATQIQRYIRLTELEPELQKMVDEGKIGMTPAVEISYLKPDEQKLLIETIDSEQATPSLSQAQRMKRLSQEGKLSDDSMLNIMMEQKKPETWDLKLPMDKIRKYFPRSYTPQRMEETIIKLLETWMKKRQRDQQR